MKMQRYCFGLALLLPLIAAAAADDGLIFYAPLDGSAVSKTAAATVSPEQPEKLRYVDGKFGKAVRLEGDAKLIYPAKNVFSFEKGTLALWFRRDLSWESQRGWQMFRATSGKEWNRECFYVAGTRWKELSVSVYDAEKIRNLVLSPNGIPLPAGSWQHWTVTWDGPRIRVYRNGEEISYKVKADPVCELPQAAPQVLQFGSGHNADAVLQGELDELRIYNRELAPGEVKRLFESTPANGVSQ